MQAHHPNEQRDPTTGKPPPKKPRFDLREHPEYHPTPNLPISVCSHPGANLTKRPPTQFYFGQSATWKFWKAQCAEIAMNTHTIAMAQQYYRYTRITHTNLHASEIWMQARETESLQLGRRLQKQLEKDYARMATFHGENWVPYTATVETQVGDFTTPPQDPRYLIIAWHTARVKNTALRFNLGQKRDQTGLVPRYHPYLQATQPFPELFPEEYAPLWTQVEV